MEEKISIIIPVYRVEAYLPRCLDSVLGQTYRNLEIILVDDGSPDSCGEICDRYAQRDGRVRVIHKENAGVASARNDGIAAAGGAYLCFLDSDDWLREDACEILCRGLEQYDADCAVGRCVRVIDRDGRLTPQKEEKVPVRCESAQEAMRHVLLEGSAVWNRLFRREVFERVRFPVGRINDDEVVALHAYAECRRIVFLDQAVYFYRIRRDSITTSKFSLRNVDCYYNSCDNLAFVRQRAPELTDCAEYKCIKALLYCYVNLRRMKKDARVKALLETLRGEIRRERAAACRNPFLTPALKLLAVVCSL